MGKRAPNIHVQPSFKSIVDNIDGFRERFAFSRDITLLKEQARSNKRAMDTVE
ncbi:hypothetical protein D3C85_1925050 [compost metagenome]